MKTNNTWTYKPPGINDIPENFTVELLDFSNQRVDNGFRCVFTCLRKLMKCIGKLKNPTTGAARYRSNRAMGEPPMMTVTSIGSALRNAQNHINTEYVVIHDADLEYNPQDLYSMYNLVDGKNLVLGSRFIGDAHRINIYKRTLLANKVMSTFFSVVHQKKISDVATCYKMMPSSFFKNIDFMEEGFSIEIEILSKFLKQNRSISEVPIQYNGRTYEQGKKIKTKDGFLYLFNTLKYRLR